MGNVGVQKGFCSVHLLQFIGLLLNGSRTVLDLCFQTRSFPTLTVQP